MNETEDRPQRTGMQTIMPGSIVHPHPAIIPDLQAALTDYEPEHLPYGHVMSPVLPNGERAPMAPDSDMSFVRWGHACWRWEYTRHLLSPLGPQRSEA